MVADAAAGAADAYVLLSNDSDQVGALRLMKEELGALTGIAFPMETARSSKALMATKPDHVAFVSRPVLEVSQFPDRLVDRHGKIHKPPTWS